MSAHFQRAIILIDQSRHAQAEAELRQALAADPDDALAHAFLALCLAKREAFEDATREAQAAIALAPDLAFAHYVLASVLEDRNRYDEALAAIEEAIRLDPEDADYYALLAGIRMGERKWALALAAAEEGLRIDAENVGCTNLRAMALVKLGRREEAGVTIDAALAKDPENAVTHANQGWTLLEQGEPKKAMEHFREALRLEPELDWARAGIVEALKARNLIYGLMLRYFLFMARLGRAAQWAIIIGGYLAYRFLSHMADANPDIAPYLWPILVAYIIFALLTWIAYPFFNLLLRIHPFGRYALSRRQVIQSNCMAALLVPALIALGWWAFTEDPLALILAAVLGLTVLPLTVTFVCPAGWPRTIMIAYTACLAVAGLASLGLLLLNLDVGVLLFQVFLWGSFLSAFVANGLMMVTVRR
jgi:tetratricopeptide (TPR) repeat protein